MIGSLSKFFYSIFEGVGLKQKALLASTFTLNSSNQPPEQPSQQHSLQQTDRAVLFRQRLQAMLLSPVWSLNLGEDLKAKSRLG
jgi:hypothetical protein